MCVFVCNSACIWRLEVDTEYLSQLILINFLKKSLSLNLKLVDLASPRDPLVSVALDWAYSQVLFTGAWDQTQFPMLL